MDRLIQDVRYSAAFAKEARIYRGGGIDAGAGNRGHDLRAFAGERGPAAPAIIRIIVNVPAPLIRRFPVLSANSYSRLISHAIP